MTEKIKLVACDMDGTLLNKEKLISQQNIDAIKKLRSRGIYFVIATGRHDSMITTYLDILGIEMPVISCNGAMVREPFSGRMFSSIPLKSEQILDVVEISKTYAADYHIFGRDVIYGETLTSKLSDYNIRNVVNSERDQIKLFVSEDYKSYIEENSGELYKVLIIPSRREDFAEIQKDVFKKTGLDAFQSDVSLLDVAQKGISKAHALDSLCKELNIRQDETAAIGDYLNDLEMIQYAGVGIAMKNAVPELKDAAQIVTEKTNDESAVAEALERLLDLTREPSLCC
ncbi:MAG: hypothetical protein B6241_11650 [Spirochaetaceae bacterium 4572_59]|nr:MAG: hypothetical protein B6241_11650 [Spirochaetaceae bacterium 4572_59]